MALLDTRSTEDLTDEALAALGAKFETASAGEIVAWAVERFHPQLCLTASMTDAVLIDVAVAVEPAIEVVFIDTGYHFTETMETLEKVRAPLRAQPADNDRPALRGAVVAVQTPSTAAARPRSSSSSVPSSASWPG